MKWLESLIVALSMYSKIPVPQIEWNKQNMRYALCWFPAVGVVTGLLVWLWSLDSDTGIRRYSSGRASGYGGRPEFLADQGTAAGDSEGFPCGGFRNYCVLQLFSCFVRCLDRGKRGICSDSGPGLCAEPGA